MQDPIEAKVLDHIRNRYYGKYRGRVTDNNDPTRRGRLKIQVPAVLGDIQKWAMPCVPYAGTGVGAYLLPEPGAGVWAEFEGGDPSFPIWTGGYWTDGELPANTDGDTASPSLRIIRSETGLIISLDDQKEVVTISDKTGDNIITIEVAQGKIKVKGSTSVVIEASGVQLGDEGASHPLVKGDLLLTYLTSLAVAVMPQNPPTPAMLSFKVKTS